MYIEFSITSDVTTGFKYMTTQMKTDRYVQNIYPFSKFRGVIPENWPLFFISRIHASHYRNTLFVKRVRAWYPLWSGVGEPGLPVNHTTSLECVIFSGRCSKYISRNIIHGGLRSESSQHGCCQCHITNANQPSYGGCNICGSRMESAS